MLEELKVWLEEELASVDDNTLIDVDSGADVLSTAYWSGRRNSLINTLNFIELKEALDA